MTTLTDKGPLEGYLHVAPKVEVAGDVAAIDSEGVYYRQLNEAIRAAFDAGAKTVRVLNVNGQRYIGTGIKDASRTIEITGTPGNDLAMFMDGRTVYVHGDAGDVLGYGMRGGRVFIKGDVGYRVGIHMKAFETNVPIMVCGGNARDFFGEYMAGGLLVLLGMETQFADQPLVGAFCGTGMHGGTIFLRGSVEEWQIGKECGIFTADEDDLAKLRPVLEEWCEAFGRSMDEVLSVPFTKLVPVSHRPYGKLYANM
jgi:glutamate synthase domain-containing protein 3